jgi:hypothetical protein
VACEFGAKRSREFDVVYNCRTVALRVGAGVNRIGIGSSATRGRRRIRCRAESGTMHALELRSVMPLGTDIGTLVPSAANDREGRTPLLLEGWLQPHPNRRRH